ncbi:MAG TPA: sulfotransferase domain-containing protein [Bauldia sp.]|nr:sulfotransferase domain-containing protein [Bauldia sp.]
MILLGKANPKGIIWIASYPRSGNTWTRAFISSLLRVQEDPDVDNLDINQIDVAGGVENAAALYPRFLGKPASLATPAEIAAVRPWVQAALVESAGRPIYLKTHLANAKDHGAPLINMSVSLGAVYIVRNPLDVAISYARFAGAPIDKAIEWMATSGFGFVRSRFDGHERVREIMGSWSENVASWVDPPHPAVLVVRYEDMLAEPYQVFSRIARHLQIKATRQQILRAMELSSFERLRAQESASGFKEKPQSGGESFFRSGRAGQWRETLSEDQVARIVAAHRPLMKRFRYLPSQSDSASIDRPARNTRA